MPKYVLSLKNFLKNDIDWQEFLSTKSDKTAKRYNSDRNRFFKNNPTIEKEVNVSKKDKKNGIKANSIFQNEAKKTKRQVMFIIKRYSPPLIISKFALFRKNKKYWDITPQTKMQLKRLLNDITMIYRKYKIGFRMRIICHYNIFNDKQKLNDREISFNGDITSVGDREFKSLLNQLRNYLINVIYSSSLTKLEINLAGIKFFVMEQIKEIK